jgi:formylglycine-generating enzyme required for sulfatase activity
MPDDEGWGRGNHPVINVTFLEILGYIDWLNEVTGDTYSLPTETQWEYAARGGTTTKFYTGDTINVCQANFRSSHFSQDKTVPVGSYPPNQYGLYDMSGNVWEVCIKI